MRAKTNHRPAIPPVSPVVQELMRSRMYLDYERAFTEATGLPLRLDPADADKPARRPGKGENAFCLLMARSNSPCEACLAMQREVEAGARLAPKTLRCFAGLCETAVPVRVGEDTIAFLRTGQVLLHKPSKARFDKVARLLLKLGTDIDSRAAEEAWFATRIISPRQYESVVRLLTIFAEHLASVSNQVVIRRKNAEPPVIEKAKAFIAANQDDALSLGIVARAVNMSAFYFCRTFRRATGISFTDYLARVRIEKARNLLLNPHKRISEVAFEVGFQSLSQFNRVFRKIAGQSPTAYREGIQA